MAAEPTLDLARVIEARDFPALQAMLKHWSPPTAAGFIEGLPVHQQVVAFRVLPRDLAADVFEYLALDAQEQLLKAMAKEEVAKILNEMAPDDRTALLEELPGTGHPAAAATAHPRGAGRGRHPARLPRGQHRPAHDARLRRACGPTGPCRTCSTTFAAMATTAKPSTIVYVIEERGRLIGEIPIREILLLPPETRVADVMDESRRGAEGDATARTTAIPLFQQDDRVALPVTDSNGALIGIVTVDDVLDVAEEEATEDIQKFGGMEALDAPYLRCRCSRHGPQAGGLAGRALPRRDAHRHRHGLTSRTRSRRRSCSRSSSR